MGGSEVNAAGAVVLPGGSSNDRDPGIRTILFTDIVDSTSLTRRIGDEAAMELLEVHDSIVRDALADLGGREIKHLGDGIMASFVSAAAAVKCASRVQREVARHGRENKDRPFSVRLGIAAGEPVGAAIAFRGPLGINFSFLENRCDLLLHPTLPVSEVPDTVACLLSASAAAYRDFELNEIPLIADEMATDVLLKLGAEFLRHYCQGIWLQAGHQGFYQHVNGFYSRLLARAEKQKMKRSRAASESR